MDNLNELSAAAAESAEADKNQAAAVAAKFKDVQTLMKAYSDLEAEFTRRSQRLKELERGNKAQSLPDAADAAPSVISDEELISAVRANGRVRDAVIYDYLKGVSSSAAVPLVTGGGGVATPRVNPKSVKDAGKLAQEYLKD